MTTTGYVLQAALRSPAAQDAALVLATWLEQLRPDLADTGRFEVAGGQQNTAWGLPIHVGYQEVWDKSESGLLLRWLANNIIDHEAQMAPQASYSYAQGGVLILEHIGLVRVMRAFRGESERHNFVVAVKVTP